RTERFLVRAGAPLAIRCVRSTARARTLTGTPLTDPTVPWRAHGAHRSLQSCSEDMEELGGNEGFLGYGAGLQGRIERQMMATWLPQGRTDQKAPGKPEPSGVAAFGVSAPGRRRASPTGWRPWLAPLRALVA